MTIERSAIRNWPKGASGKRVAAIIDSSTRGVLLAHLIVVT